MSEKIVGATTDEQLAYIFEFADGDYAADFEEVRGLKAGSLRRLIARLRAAEKDAAELRKDHQRLNAIQQECWDVRFLSSPNGDAGDSSISIEIVGHFMAEPCERVVGENYSENLRDAIDQAMSAPAYPPERPEYDEPEWMGAEGSGNKARRRAESLGIDYDAAMERQP